MGTNSSNNENNAASARALRECGCIRTTEDQRGLDAGTRGGCRIPQREHHFPTPRCSAGRGEPAFGVLVGGPEWSFPCDQEPEPAHPAILWILLGSWCSLRSR